MARIPLTSLPPSLRRAATSGPGTLAAYVAHGLRHPALLSANAAPAARALALPGDDLVSDPEWSSDFTTTIRGRPSDVWPWLVQLGYGRAGWYTWYRFDNGDVASADIIVPALQRLAVGDIIPDGPRTSDGYGVWRVRILERDHAMVLTSRRHPVSGREVEVAPYIESSWAFTLRPLDDGGTMLHVRVRAKLHPGAQSRLALRLAFRLSSLAVSVFENTLLDGIKRRVEGAHLPTSAAPIYQEAP